LIWLTYNIIMLQISKTFTMCFTVTEVQDSWLWQRGDEGQAYPEVPQARTQRDEDHVLILEEVAVISCLCQLFLSNLRWLNTQQRKARCSRSRTLRGRCNLAGQHSIRKGQCHGLRGTILMMQMLFLQIKHITYAPPPTHTHTHTLVRRHLWSLSLFSS